MEALMSAGSWMAHGAAALPVIAGILPDFATMTGWLSGIDLYSVWALAFGILLLCGFGLPVPEDITLVAVGYMTYFLNIDGHYGDGRLLVTLAVLVGMAGVVIGDATMFTLGARLGGKLMHRAPFRSILGSGRREKAAEFLQAKGPQVLFSARFMPGLRSVVFFTSGTLGIRLRTFLFFDGLAALLSVPALVLSSWYFGEQIQDVITYAQKSEQGILAIIVLVAAGAGVKYWWGKRKAAQEAAAQAAGQGRAADGASRQG